MRLNNPPAIRASAARIGSAPTVSLNEAAHRQKHQPVGLGVQKPTLPFVPMADMGSDYLESCDRAPVAAQPPEEVIVIGKRGCCPVFFIVDHFHVEDNVIYNSQGVRVTLHREVEPGFLQPARWNDAGVQNNVGRRRMNSIAYGVDRFCRSFHRLAEAIKSGLSNAHEIAQHQTHEQRDHVFRFPNREYRVAHGCTLATSPADFNEGFKS